MSSVCEQLDFNGDSETCTTQQPGICEQGSYKCVNKALICVPKQQPTAEICGDGTVVRMTYLFDMTGLDNNCDGQVDENCAPAGFVSCVGNPQWMPVTCTTTKWVWSADRAFTTVSSAGENKVLWTGDQHTIIPNTCSLNGQGYVSTQVFTMSGCNTSWWHLGGTYTGACGGHDGDQVRRLSHDDAHCYAY